MGGWFRWGRWGRRSFRDLDLVRASPYFDEAWYRAQYRDVVGRGTAAEHYIELGAALGWDPGPLFSTSGYLADYPDVARAGMNPLVHFLRYGQFEGRLPRATHTALGLDEALWAGGDASEICPALTKIIAGASIPGQERLYAAWALVRWYGAKQAWGLAQELLPLLLDADPRYFFHRPLALVEIDALIRGRLFDAAEERINAALAQYPVNHDLRLARANLLASSGGNEDDRLGTINEVFALAGLGPLRRTDTDRPLSLDNLCMSPKAQHADNFTVRPLVSVLVPAFNAEDTLATALGALRQQDWAALEVLVIDDGSTDRTAEVAESFSRVDARFRVLRRSFCEGAYAARNTALRQTRGEFITVHDADDWSHPEKIARQVAHLLSHPDHMACMSHWVRCTDRLEFGAWRIESGWIERNNSSLMFRRRVFEDLGYWDRVKAGADTEFIHRIIETYGERAVSDVLTGIPLSFGRTGPESLTGAGETHIRTTLSGVRKVYLNAAISWHESAKDPQSLRLPEEPEQRPFPAPPSLVVDVQEFEGKAEARPGQRNILLVSHAWSSQLFGAERCFLDLVKSAGGLAANVFVAVPEKGREDHFSVLAQNAVNVVVLPYSWWQRGKPTMKGVEANFRKVIRRYGIDLVYCNTSVLHEPLVASRACGVRATVHVHELPEEDEDLCETLNARPKDIQQHIVELADYLVAPSSAVASWLGAPERTVVVPNTFDAELLGLPPRCSGTGLHISLISSNNPKKGLEDFVKLAAYLSEAGHGDICCLLIGPDNIHSALLKEQQSLGRISKNLQFAGFASNPIDAIAQSDVVVNLSHVKESFGRTALEAMAGGRPVVCYDRGALRELVVNGETGFLVPFANVQAVAERVLELYRDPERRRKMGEAGRVRAELHYSPATFLRKLSDCLKTWLP